MTSVCPTTLVLCGGGIKGCLLLGALENVNLINVKQILGTSIGGIIGFLLICGYTPREILLNVVTKKIINTLVKSASLQDLINSYGILKFDPIECFLLDLYINSPLGTGEKQFPTLEELYNKTGILFIVNTFNTTKHVLEYISCLTHKHLSIITALQMTSALPFLFKPVLFEHNFYIDGGIIDNFMISFAKELGTNVLGITICQPLESNVSSTQKTLFGLINYAYSIINIPLRRLHYNLLEHIPQNNIWELDDSSNFNMFNLNIEPHYCVEMFCQGKNYISSSSLKSS